MPPTTKSSTTIPPGGNHQIRVEVVEASVGSTAVVTFSSDQVTVEGSIGDWTRPTLAIHDTR